jgi:hypothetical protein
MTPLSFSTAVFSASDILPAMFGYDVFIGVTARHRPGRWQKSSALLEKSNRMREHDYTVQRTEDRVGMRVTALLVGGHLKLGVETGLTENVSSRGARVISTSEWLRDDTILVAVPGFHFTAVARVAYCDPLGDGRFSTGLEFVAAGPHLEITALAAALEFPRQPEQQGSRFHARARRSS